MKRRLFILPALLMIVLLLVSACGSAASETPAEEELSGGSESPATAVLEPKSLRLSVGDNFRLDGSLSPEGAVIWESDDRTVATVSNTGEVNGVGAGTCLIRMVSAENPDAYAQCVVVVEQTNPEVPDGETEEAEQEDVEPETFREEPADTPQDDGEDEPEEKILIAIDPGHQSKSDTDKEPLGPGSDEMKTKVSAGTRGVSTGTPEYELNLQVSLKLQEELERRGYAVLMIRTTNDASVSNVERAQMANDAGADVLLRIHADGSEDATVSGAMTICMTSSNPYNSYLYEESKRLSQTIVGAICDATGAKNRGVWETDTMTGINWSEIPVTIIEMGYMTNPEEDQRMATEEYQLEIVLKSSMPLPMVWIFISAGEPE